MKNLEPGSSFAGKPFGRREFLAAALTTTGGLVVAFYVPSPLRKAFGADVAAPKAAVYPPNAFIQIAPDNSITLVINKLEMGQGVNTSLAQLIAEELECDWKSIRSVSAPVDAVYNAVGMPIQMTGGSGSIRTSWEQHRKVGAACREMLRSAAAAAWGIPVADTRAENGFIVNAKSGLKLSYGALSEAAAKLPLPENPPLKAAKDFKVIGKSTKRVDAAEKINGKAVFGIDVRVPGMLYAAVARPSLGTAKLLSHDDAKARAVKGVVRVVAFGNKVAVLAHNTFAARKAANLLNPKWDYGKDASTTTASIMAGLKDLAKGTGVVAETRGDAVAELAVALARLELEYEFPYLAHAPMEPMNCTIDFDGKNARLWSGFQMPTNDRGAAAKTLGIPEEKITINTVYAGGSFGRRASKTSDYVVEACALAKIVKKPLKITWSREDDMRGGYYRPMYFHKVAISLDTKNVVRGWDHRIAGQGIMAGSPFAMMMKNGVDPTVVEGVTESAYKFPNFRCQQMLAETPITTLWWRSVGNTHTAYVMETAIDELAERAGRDPFDYRRALLKESPRHLAVLDLLQKRVGSEMAKPAPGRAFGLAVHESFQSVVGHVAEVSIENGDFRVHRVWSAVHCGQVINPEVAKSQIEGGVVFGISSLRQEIQLHEGELRHTNFDTYPVLRMKDMPVVSVDFVTTEDAPTGLGEPGVPPIAPAVANALYRLTKKRLRVLPYGVASNPAVVGTVTGAGA